MLTYSTGDMNLHFLKAGNAKTKFILSNQMQHPITSGSVCQDYIFQPLLLALLNLALVESISIIWMKSSPINWMMKSIPINWMIQLYMVAQT